MSLKLETIIWIENQKKIADLQKDITTLNSIAQTALNAKRAEQTVIQDELTIAVKAKLDEIDVINNT